MEITQKNGVKNTFIVQLIRSLPNAATLIEANTNVILYCNQAYLSLHRINNSSNIQNRKLTLAEVLSIESITWNKAFLATYQLLDKKIIKKQEAIRQENLAFIDNKGMVQVINAVKMPILDESNNATNILTLEFEQTKNQPLFKLHKLYQKILGNSAACRKSMTDYLCLTHFFKKPLTERELICLLWMKYNKSTRYIADRMNVSIRTIEDYLKNIRSKLREIELMAVVEYLRRERE